MNYLLKSNGKDNCLKSRVFVSPVKMLKCGLDPFGTTQSIYAKTNVRHTRRLSVQPSAHSGKHRGNYHLRLTVFTSSPTSIDTKHSQLARLACTKSSCINWTRPLFLLKSSTVLLLAHQGWMPFLPSIQCDKAVQKTVSNPSTKF